MQQFRSAPLRVVYCEPLCLLLLKAVSSAFVSCITSMELTGKESVKTPPLLNKSSVYTWRCLSMPKLCCLNETRRGGTKLRLMCLCLLSLQHYYQNKLKLAIIGQSLFGQEVYSNLRKQGHKVVGVFTVPDKDGKADPLGEFIPFSLTCWFSPYL